MEREWRAVITIQLLSVTGADVRWYDETMDYLCVCVCVCVCVCMCVVCVCVCVFVSITGNRLCMRGWKYSPTTVFHAVTPTITKTIITVVKTLIIFVLLY